MAFQTNFKSYNPSQSNFRKNEFVDQAIGKNTLRILGESATVFDTHFLMAQKTMIKCLGDDCPICEKNKVLYNEARSKAGGQKVNTQTIIGYISRNQTAYVNVLDRTPVKICPNTECGAEVKSGQLNGKFPVACPKCGASLTNVSASPLNKVKIFNFGKELGAQIEATEASTLTPEGDPVGLMNMDIALMVMQNGAKKTRNITADVGRDLVDVSPESLFDLEKACLEVTADEMEQLVRGVQLRDILRARSANATQADAPGLDPDVASDIDKLF